MTWKTTRFERQKLFDEVWATPVAKLAKGQQLDVHLVSHKGQEPEEAGVDRSV